MELALLGVALIVVPVALPIVAFAVASAAWRNEKDGAEYLREMAAASADDLREEQQAHRFWVAQAGETSKQLSEAYAEQEFLRTQLEEAEGAIKAASEAVDFLTEKVVELVDEVGDLEDEVEELEEESDGFEESATEAFEQLTIANDLVKHTLAWSERVLDVLERSEEEHR